MIAWIAYAFVVTLLLGAAALAAEGSARLRRASTRWIWAAAIVAAPVLPAIISTVSIQLPASVAPTTAGAPIALREATLPVLTPSAWLPAKTTDVAAEGAGGIDINHMLERAWAAVSLAMLLTLAASAVALHLRMRRWPQRRLCGADVLVAPDAGPAVVGLLRPRIVIPGWLLDAPPLQQSLVIAHEKEHVDARDPHLLAFAITLLALMPWNLPLWWLVHRLRHAIEVDCDARVLRGGHDVRQYGDTLVDVGQRQSGFIGAGAAMAESRSLLEQRIRIMLRTPGRKGRALAILLGGVAVGAVAIAAQVAPPPAVSARAAPVARQQVDLPASRLVDYEGTYQLDEFVLMTITRDGRRLWSQVTGRPPVEQYAERQDAFFSRDIDAQIEFRRDARGRVNGLVLHSLGAEFVAPRLDREGIAAASIKINQNNVRTRPRPGGEAALRRNIDLVLEGRVHLEDLTPQYGQQALRMMPAIKKDLAPSGRMKSITFLAVDDNGWDVYRVQHEHGQRDWYLLVNSDGKVAGAYTREVL
ncbi:MAG: M56 family metallopeptidase [Telluria sp.]